MSLIEALQSLRNSVDETLEIAEATELQTSSQLYINIDKPSEFAISEEEYNGVIPITFINPVKVKGNSSLTVDTGICFDVPVRICYLHDDILFMEKTIPANTYITMTLWNLNKDEVKVNEGFFVMVVESKSYEIVWQ